MEVLKAVRISISIPIFFTPVRFENKLFVDGCCLDNYPIHVFDKRLDNVLGLYTIDKKTHNVNIKCIEDYLSNTINCLMGGIIKNIDSKYKKHTITIICDKYGDSVNDVISLFDTGYATIKTAIKDNFFMVYDISI
jgi:predicted patatin/cPLA2 family phospholipase